MLYPEPGKWLDKPRLLFHDGRYHLFYVEGRTGSTAPATLAHAVSTDLLAWEATTLLLEPGPPGAWDSGGIGAASPIIRDGVCHVLYTGRNEQSDAGLGLAWTEDWQIWHSHPRPVLLPDPRWYETTPAAGEELVWGDPCLWHNPSDGFTYVFLAARTKQHAGCLALARSRDLVQWEVLPPAYAPISGGDVGFPEVFRWQNQWIMTFACCDGAETRCLVSDDPLHWDSSDAGRVLMGGADSLDAHLCTAVTTGGRGAVHVARQSPDTPPAAGEPESWLALPKTLSGEPDRLTLTVRSDLYTAPINCLDCEQLVMDQMECWHTEGDVLTAITPGGRTFLPLSNKGNRTASALIEIDGSGEGGYVIGLDEIIVAVTSDGQVATRTGGSPHTRSWDVGMVKGELSVALVDRHVEVYFNRRFLGTACAVKPGEKTLALFCAGTLSIVFSGVAVRVFKLEYQARPVLMLH